MFTTIGRLAALGALIALISVPEVSAQRRRGLVDVTPPNQRHGGWLSFGLGAGTDAYHYDGEGYGHDLTKPAFYIAGGGTVNPNLRLGGEINAWVNEYTDQTGVHVTESLVGGLLTGQFYPARELGLFVKGGLGISRSGADVYGPGDSSETGFAYQFGAGYEIRLARNFFLTPAATVLYHRSTSGDRSIVDNGGTLRERVIMIGVGLTIQPGR